MTVLSDAVQGEHLYRLILDHAVDAFVAIDEKGRIVEWSRHAESMFGWRREDALGLPLIATIMPERYRATYTEGLEQYRHTGQSPIIGRRLEVPVRCKDGGEVAVELMIAPIDIEGRRFFSASIKDITRRRELEEELRTQARIMMSILEGMGDGVLVTDDERRVVMINPVARRMLNLPVTEVDSGQQFPPRFYHPENGMPYSEEERPVVRALQGESVNGVVALIYPTGATYGVWVSVNARPLRNAAGHITGTVMVIHDITELRRSQEDYRLLVAASTEHAILMTDPAGIIMKWNPGAEKMFGLPQEEAIDQHVSRLFTREDCDNGEPMRELNVAHQYGRSEDDRWLLRQDGSRFWASGVVTPLWDEAGCLRGYVKIMRDQTAQRLAEEQTQFLANHDVLTGLPNRVHFSSRLHQAVAHYERNQEPFAILMLDLDKFKQINDTCGHPAGDKLLQEVSARILSSLRETDFVARLGGDEFVVIQTDVSQPDAAEVLARKLILQLSAPYRIEDGDVESGASIGISIYPTDATSSVELVKSADIALYRAKNSGRGTFCFYTPELFAEHDWKRNRGEVLRKALSNHEFTLYYQPQIDLADWRIASAEALLRWKSDDVETILPDTFLDVAEETGLIIAIGEWTLRQACMQVKSWQQEGMPELRISINCSARQFSNPDFVDLVPPVLAECGLSPSSLELEITESMLAKHPEIKQRLAQLRALGVRITIDNYGTGTTALLDLKEFEVDSLKIDRAFVQHLPHRRKDAAIAASIINLAQNLGIDVSAGGVETVEQLAYLKSRDCRAAQGYIFSPPVPAEKFQELMRNGAWSRVNRLSSKPMH